MKRDLVELENRKFDLIVIGGGIHGAFVAWDAALRGLSVALIEKGDFGGATSANSLKTIHGGLRYLQDGNLRLVQQMIRERAIWLSLAPHLVHPQAFVIPTYKSFTRHKITLKAALLINDWLTSYQNSMLDRPLPLSRLLSVSELTKIRGWVETEVTGGALWYDAQIYNSERLLFAVIMSAVEAGAIVANYAEVTSLVHDGTTVSGVIAQDKLSAMSIRVDGRVVVNCTGAWADTLLAQTQGVTFQPTFPMSVAANFVTRRLYDDYALGLTSHGQGNGLLNKGSRLLFIIPWGQFSLIGTWHIFYDGKPHDGAISRIQVKRFVEDCNRTDPTANLKPGDVYHVQFGYLPAEIPQKNGTKVRLLRNTQIHDHCRTDGIENLITVTGVKYTMARLAAENTVNLVQQKLGHDTLCTTAQQALYGGNVGNFEHFLEKALVDRPDQISAISMKHLVHTYGINYRKILAYGEENQSWLDPLADSSPVLKAEVIHAVRNEIPCSLADLVRRRLPLGAAGPPTFDSLFASAHLMSAELGWDQNRTSDEIDAVYSGFGVPKSLEKIF